MTSWAERARQAREAAVAPALVETAPAPQNSSLAEEQPAELNERVSFPAYAKGLVVLDANAFIKGLSGVINDVDALVTVPQVVKEVKDARARELLERLPFPLTLLDPTTQSLREVVNKAKLTGDFGALSRTDIRVAALALDLAKQTGCKKSEIEPRPAAVNPSDSHSGVAVVDGESEPQPPGEAEEESESDASDDTEGSGDWITPNNVKSVQSRQAGGDAAEAFHGGIACVTSDFPMQNTLLHLGVPVVSPNGIVIAQLRTWLLRCHACFGLTHDTARQFCPECGSGNTLRRVSYVVLADGTKQLFINFKKQISKRGTIYALPKPRGGRRGTNKTLALREDQLAHVQGRRATKEQRVESADAPFGETKRRRFDPDKPRVESSYRSYNPNERKKQLAGRHK